MSRNRFAGTKAFIFNSEEDGTFVLFFPSLIEAVRKAQEMDEDTTVKAAPEFDQFWQLGYVPASALVENGWRLHCDHCEMSVDNDKWNYYKDVPIHPVFWQHKAYCCFEHSLKAGKAKAIRAIRFKQARAFLLSCFPKAQNLHLYASDSNLFCSFRLEGAKYRASWASDNPDEVTVYPADSAVYKSKRNSY